MQTSIKSFIKRIVPIFFVLAFVVLTTLVLKSRTEKIYIIDPNNTDTMTSIPLKDAQLKIGDIFIKDDIEVQITKLFARNYMLVQSTNVFPTKGSVYIVVHYHYKNNTSKIIEVSDQPRIKLQDASGIIYESDNDGTIHYFTEREETPVIFSDLNPNLSFNNALVFEVPEASAHVEGWQVLVEGLGSSILIDIS